MKEVIFLLIHGIFPYRDRMARFVRTETLEYGLCGNTVNDGLKHGIIECPWSGVILEKKFEIEKGENMGVDSVEERKKIVKLSFECEKKQQKEYCFF